MVEIAEEFACAHDGAGHQLREERNEQRVIDGIGDRFLFPAVNIDHVRHALEGVEADSQGKNDAEREGVRRLVEQWSDVGGEEIVVLEEAEQSEIGGQADHQRGLARVRRLSPRDPARRGVIDRGERQQQQNELRNEAHVEEVAGGQKNVFPPGPRRGVKQNQDDGEKYEELRGVKQHAAKVWAGPGRGEPRPQESGELLHSVAVHMPSIPEQVGMFELVEQALIQDNHVRLGRQLPYGAGEFERSFGRRHRRARHAHKDELGARAAIIIDHPAIPIAADRRFRGPHRGEAWETIRFRYLGAGRAETPGGY